MTRGAIGDATFTPLTPGAVTDERLAELRQVVLDWPADPFASDVEDIHRALRELQQARSTIAALEQALRRYSWHGGGEVMCERVKGSQYPCTCGLDAALAQARP